MDVFYTWSYPTMALACPTYRNKFFIYLALNFVDGKFAKSVSNFYKSFNDNLYNNNSWIINMLKYDSASLTILGNVAKLCSVYVYFLSRRIIASCSWVPGFRIGFAYIADELLP